MRIIRSVYLFIYFFYKEGHVGIFKGDNYFYLRATLEAPVAVDPARPTVSQSLQLVSVGMKISTAGTAASFPLTAQSS